MFDVIKQIIDLVVQFINAIFNFKITFVDDQEVSLGIVVVAFLFFVFSLYFILKSLRIIDERSDD